MITLQTFLAGLPTKLVFKAGEVASAYSCRAFFRTKAKAAKSELEQTIAARNGYSDPYYENGRDGANIHAQSTKVSMEKYFNKMKHQFIEEGGTAMQLTTLISILDSTAGN